MSRRITLSSFFGRILKFYLLFFYDKLWKRDHSVSSRSHIQCSGLLRSITWHMLVTALQIAYHSSNYSYISVARQWCHLEAYFYSWKTDIFTLFSFKSLSWKIGVFSFPTSHRCISASVTAPNFVLGYFSQIFLILGSGLNSILTQWALLFGIYTFCDTVYSY